MENHLRSNVLDHFTHDIWKQLDKEEMIDEPDIDTYVFARVVGEEDVYIEMGSSDDPNVQSFAPGSCLIVRYLRVRELCLEGKIELV
jgi:DNA replication complex GINS protein SLD5 C-terminus